MWTFHTVSSPVQTLYYSDVRSKGTLPKAKAQEFFSSTPYTFCGQTPQENTSTLCWHLLFAQPGAAVRDAITQFNYHVEFNGVATQQSVVGSMITTTVMVQSADCNIPVPTYSRAAELYGLQGVFIFTKRSFEKHDQLHLLQVLRERGCERFHLRRHGRGRKTSEPQSSREIKQSGMLSEAILDPTRSESDTVTVYMKLESVSVTHNFFCVNDSFSTLAACWFSIFLLYFSCLTKSISGSSEGADISSWSQPKVLRGSHTWANSAQ